MEKFLKHSMVLTIVRRLYRYIKRLTHPPLHRPDNRLTYQILGSDYGGWPVIDGSLSPESVIYSFGV
jgi:hypothetical protein